MAVEAAIGVVAEHLFSEALSLAAEEFSRVLGFKDDLESLARELETIQALIADAYAKDMKLATIQLWLKRLEVVASDAEDLLEEYKYELLRRKVRVPHRKRDKVRNFFYPVSKLTFRFEMVHKIKDINLRLKNINDDGRKYGLNPIEFLNISSEVNVTQGTSPCVQESEIIGRDDDVVKVVEMLINENNGKTIELVAIVGMGGKGKTTLAQLVSKSEKVVNYFEKILWVCVSDDFKIERLLNEMVQSIIHQNLNLTSRQALIGKLQQTLKGKRYLLVLDDVWNEDQEKWECMQKDLGEVGGSKGTKIMITTRSEKVVSTMHTSHTHYLNKLSDKDSWSLFKKRAFSESRVVDNSELMTIGQRLVKRCGGVPLAIKALGGLLYSKKYVGEWLNLERSDIWNSTTTKGGVMSAIKLSYNHLPSVSMKQCFAYCSLFPKDTIFGRDNLIQQWMANGFLNPPKGSNLQMEDLGRGYVDTLLWNSLLQESSYNKHSKTWTYKMHDIVHDFALHISKDHRYIMEADHEANDIIEAVHVSLIPNEGEMKNIPQGLSSRIRTLHLRSGVTFDKNAVLRFGCLRTLILDTVEVQELPTSIGGLELLRYIDIKDTLITSLPASYSKLYNLQTLILPWEFPQEVLYLGTLINLRHIYMPGRPKCMLVGIKELVHLQTLPHFNVSNGKGCIIEDLEKLDNLRGNLILYGLDKVMNGEKAKKANMSRKVKIDHLELHWTKQREATDDEGVLKGLIPHSYLKSLTIRYFKGSRFPSSMTARTNGILKNLIDVKLERCNLLEQLPPLGHLLHLKNVYIYGLDNVKRIGEEFYGYTTSQNSTRCAFPALEELYIEGMSNLEEWLRVERPSPFLEAFPRLRSLRVKSCRKLTKLPSIQGLSSLTELYIKSNEALTTLPTGIQSCTSLKTVKLEALQGIDGYGLERLPNLTTLEICGISEEFDYFPWPHNIRKVATSVRKGKDVQLYFGSLKKLELCGGYMSKLKSLPEQIQYLRSLTSLSVHLFSGLEALPEWMGNIQSLSYLELGYNENLKYMPSWKAMQCLTNLQELSIWHCLHLKERCTKESGSEWHKISHIQQILLDTTECST